VIVARDLDARERLRKRLEAWLETELPQAVARISPLEMGPPVGWPLQYRVTGPDIVMLREVAQAAAEVVAASPVTRQLNYSWGEPARVLRVAVDQDQARLLGLGSRDLAQILNAVMSGSTVTQLRDDIYLVDVVVRAEASERASPATLRSLQVALPNGRAVPLGQFATIAYEQEFPIVWQRDRQPMLLVQADLAPGALPASVARDLAGRIAALNATLPAGYAVTIGGTVEESAKSQASVAAVVPVMLILMLTILMVQLRSFQRLILVLSVAPLGLVGVVAALLLAGKPLGFVAILGVLALIGMIVRNSVILIDQIETERAHGRAPWDAVIEATMHRFRPILLTAAAAILGMAPIAPTVFWGPMAYAIMGGLAVATLLTLFFLPALYVAWFRIRP
jgi:multidrug efflux pump subunit AcrB